MATAFVECWKCEVCGFRWIKTRQDAPEKCASKPCRSRKWNKSQPAIMPPTPVQVEPQPAKSDPTPPKTSMDTLRAICAGKLPPSKAEVVAPVLSEPVELCSYTEYDTDTGETYGCRLPAHPAKIKHQRGPAL